MTTGKWGAKSTGIVMSGIRMRGQEDGAHAWKPGVRWRAE